MIRFFSHFNSFLSVKTKTHAIILFLMFEFPWANVRDTTGVMSLVGRCISLCRTVKTYSLSLPVNFNTNSTNLRSLPQPEHFWEELASSLPRACNLVVIKMCEIAMFTRTMHTEITFEFLCRMRNQAFNMHPWHLKNK